MRTGRKSDRNPSDELPKSDASGTRRAFMAGAAGALTGLIGGCKPSRSRRVDTRPLPGPEKFPRRRLGRSGVLVPVLHQGGDYAYSPLLVQRCIDLGVRAFDTAESYARNKGEAYVGRCLAKLKIPRQDYFLATKGRPKAPSDITHKHLPDSLKRLGLDHVDLWYIHDLDDPEVLTSAAWRRSAERAKADGMTRLFGVSCHNDKLLSIMSAAAKCGWVDALMFRYNFRSYDDQSLNDAIDICHKAGIGLLAMKTQASSASISERLDPLRAKGYSKHQAALKAVWQDNRIAAVVSAMPSVGMVEENAAAAFDRLSLAEARLLRQYAKATAQRYCSGGCGGCRRECEAVIGNRLAVADILRLLTYHDGYGRRSHARLLFMGLAPERRDITAADLVAAEQVCPNRLPLSQLLNVAFGKLST
jgi:aryl-alcohol dehydrogenase-like predicted oxidoreductase